MSEQRPSPSGSGLAAGDRAPAFALADQNGNRVRLSHFKGHKVLVFFYPKALTLGLHHPGLWAA